MLKKLQIWFAKLMMESYQGAVLYMDRAIDWDKNILSRTMKDRINIEAYRSLKAKHRLWSARYCNLLFGDENWYTSIQEES